MKSKDKEFIQYLKPLPNQQNMGQIGVAIVTSYFCIIIKCDLSSKINIIFF